MRVVCAWCNRNPYTFDIVCYTCGRPGAHVLKAHPSDDAKFVRTCISCALDRPTWIASHGICIECRDRVEAEWSGVVKPDTCATVVLPHRAKSPMKAVIPSMAPELR